MEVWLEAKPILNILPAGIVIVDHNHTVIYINPVLRQLAQSSDEIVGLQLEQLYNILQKVCVDLNTPDSTDACEKQLFDWAPIISKGQMLGRIGVFNSLLSLGIDKTELKNLKELNQELEAIFDASHDELFVTDGMGICLRVNKACERLYGLSAAQLVGHNMVELEKQEIFSPSVVPYVLKEKKLVTITQKTQSGRVITVTGNPVFDKAKKKITKIVINCRDLTELMTVEEKLEEAEKEVKRSKQEVAELRKVRNKVEDIIINSKQMLELMELFHKVALVDVDVLILGESGVGKDLFTKLIHRESNRHAGPFFNINCGAIPGALLESELFGYEYGSFTGARKEGKQGLFELCNGGTLLLNEIGELPWELQVKLLQVLQDRQVFRIGAVKPVNVDTRIVAATNKDITQMIKNGTFREDLYYRLNVMPITIPPLRDRKEDIPPLIMYYLKKYNIRYNCNKNLSPDVVKYLVEYPWPGNIRELQNVIERLIITSADNTITLNILPAEIRHPQKREGKNINLKEALEDLERNIILDSAFHCPNSYAMAESLGISQPSVIRKLKKYGITRR